MTSRERVLTALACKEPDIVPYMYGIVDTGLQEQIVGQELTDYRFDLSIDPGIIAKLGDEIDYRPNYVVHVRDISSTRIYLTGGAFAGRRIWIILLPPPTGEQSRNALSTNSNLTSIRPLAADLYPFTGTVYLHMADAEPLVRHRGFVCVGQVG